MFSNLLKIQTVFILIIFYCLQTVSLLGQEAKAESDKHIIAVLKFKNNTDVFAYDRYETGIPEMLKTELSQYNKLVVVERENIENIMVEQSLSLSGVIDETSAQEVGRLLGAEYILKGEISLINSNQLRIDSHIISVSTGQVKGEKIVGNRNKSLEKMVQLLARNIYYNLTGEGDYSTSTQVSSYPTRWFLAAAVLTGLGGGFAHLESDKAYDKYLETTTLDDFNRHFDRANNLRKVRNGLIISSAAFAAMTLVSWMSERSDDNKIYAQSRHFKPPKTLWSVNFEKGVELGLLVNF